MKEVLPLGVPPFLYLVVLVEGLDLSVAVFTAVDSLIPIGKIEHLRKLLLNR